MVCLFAFSLPFERYLKRSPLMFAFPFNSTPHPATHLSELQPSSLAV
jgi:hypothetical protein